MQRSSDFLEWVAAVLVCLVALGTLARALPQSASTCVPVERVMAEQPPTPQMLRDRNTDVVIRDMLLHD